MAYVLVAEAYKTRLQDGALGGIIFYVPNDVFPIFWGNQGDLPKEHLCNEATFIGTYKELFSVFNDCHVI